MKKQIKELQDKQEIERLAFEQEQNKKMEKLSG